jgi:hypothetical protein
MGHILENTLFALATFFIPHALRWVLKAHHVGNLYLEFTSHLLYLNELIVGVSLTIWGLRHVQESTRPLRLPPWWSLAPWLMLIAHTLLSAWWAEAAVLALDTALRWILAFGLFIAVLNREQNWGWEFSGLSIGMILHASFAYTQFGHQGVLGLQQWGESSGYISEAALWIRGHGLTPHPNILGGYLAVSIPLLLARIVKSPKRRGWLILGLIIVLLGLFSTFSRAALLGSGVGLALLGITSVRKGSWPQHMWRWLLIGFLVVIGISAAFINNNAEYLRIRWVEPLKHVLGISPLEANACELWNLQERAWYTQSAFQMIIAQPLSGVGAGNFTLALHQAWADQITGYIYQPVHNVFILLASELGVFGTIWWLLLILPPIGLTIFAHDTRRSLALNASAASVAVLGIVSSFDYYLWATPQGRLLFAFVLGRWHTLWQTDTGSHLDQE